MPASPEPAPPDDEPILVAGDTDEVGFLDAPGVRAADLVGRVEAVLDAMPAGSVLTVHSDDAAAGDAVAAWCTSTGNELVAAIAHDGAGTTFTIRSPGDDRRR